MGSFVKFDDDTLFLLSENQFNDSKAYYESVKETLKQKATVPMRQIWSDLSEKLFSIDFCLRNITVFVLLDSIKRNQC